MPRRKRKRRGAIPMELSGGARRNHGARRVWGVRAEADQVLLFCDVTGYPAAARYQVVPMTTDEAAPREELEREIELSKSFLAKNVWFNGSGSEFNDHYRVLARANARDGQQGVRDAAAGAVARRQSAVPPGKTVPEYLALAAQYQAQGDVLEARTALFEVRKLDRGNAEAATRLGILADSMGLAKVALNMLSEAVKLQPRAPGLHYNLAEGLRRQGRFQEAEASARAALEVAPNDANIQGQLGVILAQQGRGEEALRACEAAVASNPELPAAHLRLAQVQANTGNVPAARASLEKALELDPNFAAASQALKEMSPESPKPTR